MRLQSALTMNEFAGLEEEEMGLFRSKEEREERRAKRKARRTSCCEDCSRSARRWRS